MVVAVVEVVEVVVELVVAGRRSAGEMWASKPSAVMVVLVVVIVVVVVVVVGKAELASAVVKSCLATSAEYWALLAHTQADNR